MAFQLNQNRSSLPNRPHQIKYTMETLLTTKCGDISLSSENLNNEVQRLYCSSQTPHAAGSHRCWSPNLREEVAFQSSQRHSSSPNSSSPRSSSPIRCSPLSLQQIAPGCIVFLPRLNQDENYYCLLQGSAMEHEASNHPVVILEVYQYWYGEPVVAVAMLTSNPKPTEHQRTRGLPISLTPRGAEPLASSTYRPEQIMYLEGQGSMYKRTYIQTNHVYLIPVSRLLHFDHHHPMVNRLDYSSYYYLLSILQIIPLGSWFPTPEHEIYQFRPATTPQIVTKAVKPPSKAWVKKTQKLLNREMAKLGVSSDYFISVGH